ncbi:MAG: DUF2927 domain-containing protein [Pseudomonadota bacterium]
MILGFVTLSACAPDYSAQYRDYARALEANGAFRTEAAPLDAPFSSADLSRNFETIALNREYRREGGELRQAATPSVVSRWAEPVRYSLAGDGVTEADIAAYAAFADRLSGLMGLPVEASEEAANVNILILGPEERRAFVDALRENGAAERMPLLVDWSREVRYPCVGQVGFDEANPGRIIGALIVVKAELEGVFRTSCMHEELTQAMGLMNDDDGVRPSIFNDNQEFALLTEHDEYLLRILYDPRLRPGMEAEEAAALAPEIVDDLLPAE